MKKEREKKRTERRGEREMHLGGMVDCKWMDGYQFAANGGLSNERKAGGKDVFQRQLDDGPCHCG